MRKTLALALALSLPVSQAQVWAGPASHNGSTAGTGVGNGTLGAAAGAQPLPAMLPVPLSPGALLGSDAGAAVPAVVFEPGAGVPAEAAAAVPPTVAAARLPVAGGEVIVHAAGIDPAAPAEGTPLAQALQRLRAADQGRQEAPAPAAEQGAPTASAALAKEAGTPADALPQGGASPTFDGAAKKDGSAEPVRPGRWSRWLGRVPLLKRLVGTKADGPEAPPPPKTEFSKDDYGGPPYKGLSPLGRVAYGFKWGLNLLGISVLLHLLVRPVLSMFPWPLYLSEGGLASQGRVELITQMSPNQVQAAAQEAPLEFLFWDLPRMAAYEEVAFRLLDFGVLFLIAAAMAPFSVWLKKTAEKLDDLFHLRDVLTGAAAVMGWVSRRAFPIAASWAAFRFAAAHFPAWGIDPFFVVAHMTLGFALAYVAYRTRSLTAPFVAHFVHNLAIVFMAALAPTVLGSNLAATVSIMGGLFLLLPILYQLRARARDKKAALEQAIKARDENLELEKLPTRRRPWAILEAVALGLFFYLPFSPFAPPAPQTAAVEGGPAAVMVAPEPRRAPLPPAGPTGIAALTAPARPTAVEINEHARRATVQVISEGGSGSGFIIDRNGLLVSNAHVVAPMKVGDTLKVLVPGAGLVDGKILAMHAHTDIALIQLPPNPAGWHSLELGDGRRLRDGEEVIAMGHPFGMPRTVTRGIISGAAGRNTPYIKNMIQHDVPINPGNSGGPLLGAQYDAASNSWKIVVVGINTMIRTNSGQWAGIGFAIDVEVLKERLAQYKADGTISPNWAGIIVRLDDPESPTQGLRVEHVRPGSPAERAGLRRGDVILSVNGMDLINGEQPEAGQTQGVARWRRALVNVSPGKTVTMTVSREDNVFTLALTVRDEAEKAQGSLIHRVFTTPIQPPAIEGDSTRPPVGFPRPSR